MALELPLVMVGLEDEIEVERVTFELGYGVECETVTFMLLVGAMIVVLAEAVMVGLGVYADPVSRWTVTVPLEATEGEGVPALDDRLVMWNGLEYWKTTGLEPSRVMVKP